MAKKRVNSDLEHDTTEEDHANEKVFSQKNIKALRNPPKDKSVKSAAIRTKVSMEPPSNVPWLRVDNDEIWTPV